MKDVGDGDVNVNVNDIKIIEKYEVLTDECADEKCVSKHISGHICSIEWGLSDDSNKHEECTFFF